MDTTFDHGDVPPFLPPQGLRFTYKFRGGEKTGTVVSSEVDRLDPWEVLVHVRFDDGEQTTFWNSSFTDPSMLGWDEKITFLV